VYIGSQNANTISGFDRDGGQAGSAGAAAQPGTGELRYLGFVGDGIPTA
jgi:hypothetical protein